MTPEERRCENRPQDWSISLKFYCAACCAERGLAPVADCTFDAEDGLKRPDSEFSGGTTRNAEPLTYKPEARPIVFVERRPCSNPTHSDITYCIAATDNECNGGETVYTAPVQPLPTEPWQLLT